MTVTSFQNQIVKPESRHEQAHKFDRTYNRTICTCLEDLEPRPDRLMAWLPCACDLRALSWAHVSGCHMPASPGSVRFVRGKLDIGAHSNAISMLSTIKRSRLHRSGWWLSASSRSCLHRSDWLTCALICASRFDIIVPFLFKGFGSF